MYQNPASAIAAAGGDPATCDQRKMQEEFEEFYEEVFEELSKFGVVEELNICDNLGDHLVGNVYVKFSDEEDADSALKALYGRFYAGRPLICEFSPVTDFREARCRQFDEGTCARGGYCNFMHVKSISRTLKREIERRFRKKSRRSRSRSGSRSKKRRSRSREKKRSRERKSDKKDSRKSDRRDRDGPDSFDGQEGF